MRGPGILAIAAGPRVSVIQISNLGHNWTAGTGAGGSDVSVNSVDSQATYYAVGTFAHLGGRRDDPSLQANGWGG